MQTYSYQHYKGREYWVIGMAENTETSEEMVIYHDKEKKFWACPESMFFDFVEVEGVKVRRFLPI